MDSGRVKSVRDLKGRKVALFAKGIVLDYLPGKLAKEEGFGIKDFEVAFLAAPNHPAALESKAIDAALTVKPWGVQPEARGAAVRFRTADQVKGSGLDPSGRVDLNSLADQIRWYAANGYMTKEIGVDQVMDLSFLN